MKAHYDDPNFSYTHYWQGRNYEHRSEVIAISRLLFGRSFNEIFDIGGGYGRLTPTLLQFSKKVSLIEPSKKQRAIAEQMWKSYKKRFRAVSGISEKIPFPNSSAPCITMIRVMHHIPNPQRAFIELHRILKPNGILILEFANSTNFKSRIRSLLTGHPILPIPIERRSSANIKRQTIDFVNHHPITIQKLLKKNGFTIDKTLSVSNFRSPFLKKLLPQKILLWLEKKFQPLFSTMYFGPSIFVMAHKSS